MGRWEFGPSALCTRMSPASPSVIGGSYRLPDRHRLRVPTYTQYCTHLQRGSAARSQRGGGEEERGAAREAAIYRRADLVPIVL